MKMMGEMMIIVTILSSSSQIMPVLTQELMSPSISLPPSSSAFISFAPFGSPTMAPFGSPTMAPFGSPTMAPSVAPESSANCRSAIGSECFPVTQNCCPLLKDALEFDNSCFCHAIKNIKLLSTCAIHGTYNSLCPDDSSPNARSNAPGPVDSTQSTGINKVGIGVGVSLSVIGLALLTAVAIIFIRKRNSKSKDDKITPATQNDMENQIRPDPPYVSQNETIVTHVQSQIPEKIHVATVPAASTLDGFLSTEYVQYDFFVLRDATDNFSQENKIGRGGFGIVYKGLLPNGQQIAIKRLLNGSGQGDREFHNEIVLLTRLQHRNLVKLLGFCLTDDDALLVYEFVTNKSLDYFLFDNQRREELNWSCRRKIMKGVARGMMYLHEDSPIRLLHRDLKAANVLLDAEMCPKIADFGLARICDIDQTHINPTRVVGTLGYMPPEYLFHGQFSAKSDVYAFGVLILEIISGRRITNSYANQSGGESLLSYAWRCWEDKNPVGLMDPIMRNSYSRDEVVKCIHLGLLCVQEDSNLRPTMSIIVHTLNNYSVVAALVMPQQPAFISDRVPQQYDSS